MTTQRPVLGILGGMGPLSSAEFLCTFYECAMDGRAEQDLPLAVLLSDPTFPLRTGAAGPGQREMRDRVEDGLQRLIALGCQELVICCFTAHQVVPDLSAAVASRLVSLLDATLAEIAAASGPCLVLCSSASRQLGLLESHPGWPVIRDRCRFPDDDDQERVNSMIREVKAHGASEAQAAALDALIARHRVADAVFACSELHMLNRVLEKRNAAAAYRRRDPLYAVARSRDRPDGAGHPLIDQEELRSAMENLDVNPGVLDKIAMIERVSPDVARDIRDGLDASIVEYARRMYQRGRAEPRGLVAVYRDQLAARLARRGAELGLAISANDVLCTLAGFPIIQTAPHCQLYVDPMAFWAYLVGWLGAFEVGCPMIPVFNTATVTLQSAASSGPAWLGTATGACNITTSPSSRLASTSVCAAGTAVAFDRGKLAQLAECAAPVDRRAIVKLARSVTPSEHGFADATDRSNVSLLCSLSRTAIAPVMFSEALISDLMADLLADRDPLIWGMLFEPARNARLCAALEQAGTQLYGHFWSPATTHFWGARDRKIRRLELRDGWLGEADRGADRVRVPYECAAIIEGLRARRLVPNLFWAFVLVALLPRLSAIGGTRQIGYLCGFADVLCRTLDLADPGEAELHDVLRTYRLCTWGAKVIEHMPSPLAVLSDLADGEEFEELGARFASITLRQATKNLEIFEGHRRWRHVSA